MEEAAQIERAARFLNVATIGGPLCEHHVSLHIPCQVFRFSILSHSCNYHFVGSIPGLEGKHQCCEVLLKQNMVVLKILPDL